MASLVAATSNKLSKKSAVCNLFTHKDIHPKLYGLSASIIG